MRMVWIMALLMVGCTDGTDSDTGDDTEAGTDTDAGTEADTEMDTEADTEMDTEADTEMDTEADTEPPYTGNLRIFKSNSVGADFGGPADADALCDSDANNPDTRSSYKALLAGGGRVACAVPFCADQAAGQTDWVLYANEPYVLADGTALFTTNADGVFTDWPMENAIESNGINFWSGLGREWTTATDLTCDDWTSTAADSDGRVGWTASTSNGVLVGGELSCATTRPLICVEQ